MNVLLRLKAWKLFLLLGFPLLLSSIPFLGELCILLWVLIYIGWIYSVAIYMYALIPDRNKSGITYFKFSCLFVTLAFIAIIIIGGYNSEDDNSFGWILTPIVFYLFWSMLYIFSFAARMLESMIEGKIVGFSDSIKGFFCFWFYPVGVWYIQPAIKRVLNEYK